MRRAIVISVIAAALVAAAAFAAFKPGHYNGKTGKGMPVSFTASKTQVTQFTFGTQLRCSNGATARNTTTVSRIPIRNDRFSTKSPAVIEGTLNGSKASGTATITVPKLPNGRNCTSGRVAWTATRGGKAGGALTCTATGSFNGGDLQVDMGCDGEFDAFTVLVPRPVTRVDTSTAHLHCVFGTTGPDATHQTPMASCTAQDGVRLRSGRVLIRFSTNADCIDADQASVTAGRIGARAEDGPFKLKTAGC